MSLAIPADDLLRWNDITATRFRELLLANQHLLTVPTDVRSSGDVAHLLQHIVAVELLWAERIATDPATPYPEVPCTTIEEIYATHDRAIALLLPLLADDTYDWNTFIEFETRSLGRIRSTRRDVLIHLLLHSIRHYAQLAVILRQAGAAPTWPLDFLMVNATRA